MILGYKFLAKLTPSQEELIYSHFFAGNQIFNYLVFKEKEFIKEKAIVERVNNIIDLVFLHFSTFCSQRKEIKNVPTKNIKKDTITTIICI